MGVKELWSILSPLCDRKPLFELQGKTVAIDTSCWIVDSQTFNGFSSQPKMYLRNLYFRTAILLTHNVSPVFVLEGRPPKLKHDAMEKRNELRFGFRERKSSKMGSRPRLKRILKECNELLRILGLTCVQGHGEAEAMCAYLNADGLVDGCISQDSDCFLYGAKVVYKNFCVSRKGNQGGANGSIDEYRLEKIERILNLGRKEMIALALLCGCDYSDGIHGVGKEAALKLFKLSRNRDILETIKGWRRNEKKEDSNFCPVCGKIEETEENSKFGSVDCESNVKCQDFHRERKALKLNELALKKKALAIEDFPNQELIDEFLVRKGPVPTKIDVQWKQPQLTEFIVFMHRNLSWDASYAFTKIFPLLTRWQLTQIPRICINNQPKIANLFIPNEIKKVLKVKSVASYKISWKCDDETIKKLGEMVKINNKTENDEESQIFDELFSIEPREAVEKCYPDLVLDFEKTCNNKMKRKKVKIATKNKETHWKPRPSKRRLQNKKNEALSNEKNSKIDEFNDENNSIIFEDSDKQFSIASSSSKLSKRPQKNSKPNANLYKLTKLQNKENETLTNKNSSKIDEFSDENNSIIFEDSDKQFSIASNSSKISKHPQKNAKPNSNLYKLTKLQNSFDETFDEFSSDDFNSDVDDLNMSEVIDDICCENVSKIDDRIAKMEKFEDEEKREEIDDNDLIIIDDELEMNKDEIVEIMDESGDESEFPDIVEDYVPLSERILINK